MLYSHDYDQFDFARLSFFARHIEMGSLGRECYPISPVKQALRGDGLHKCCDNDYRAVIIDMHYLKQL